MKGKRIAVTARAGLRRECKEGKRPQKRRSPILASMLETASGLHRIGLMNTRTFRQFQRMCG